MAGNSLAERAGGHAERREDESVDLREGRRGDRAEHTVPCRKMSGFGRWSVVVRLWSFFVRQSSPALADADQRLSEILHHPDIGSAAGLPEGERTAVGRRNPPSHEHLGLLQNGSCPSLQVYVQQSVGSGRGRGTDPEGLAIGGPIEGGDGCPARRVD